MKPVKITITNYANLALDYRTLIAPYYKINNLDGQWIKKIKSLLVGALTELNYDAIQESNISKSTVTFAFVKGEATVYTIECAI